MATLAQKIKCEQDAREMLRSQDLPQPDWVEYGHTCIRLLWEESKVALVVEIDKPPDGFDTDDEYPDELAPDDIDEAGEDAEYDEAVAELERLDIGGPDEEADMI